MLYAHKVFINDTSYYLSKKRKTPDTPQPNHVFELKSISTPDSYLLDH